MRPTAQWHYSQSKRQALFVSKQLKVLKKNIFTTNQAGVASVWQTLKFNPPHLPVQQNIAKHSSKTFHLPQLANNVCCLRPEIDVGIEQGKQCCSNIWIAATTTASNVWIGI